MNWQLVSLADVPPQPWKNGGGTTRELLAWPAAANWRVRLSVAEVVADGPFSRFDGVQRWFVVLGGAGVRLVVDGVAHTVTATDGPLAFDGAAETQCTLLDGPTQDFNLMLRGGTATVRRVHGGYATQVQAPMEPTNGEDDAMKLVAIYIGNTRGSATFGTENTPLEAHTLAWRRVPGGTRLAVEAADALWMEIAA